MSYFDRLDPEFRERLLDTLYAALNEGISYRLTSGYRSVAKQRKMYARYLRGLTEYPVAPPGRSMHNYGLAMDLLTDDLPFFVAIARAHGLRWAGARDPVHFEFATFKS